MTQRTIARNGRDATRRRATAGQAPPRYETDTAPEFAPTRYGRLVAAVVGFGRNVPTTVLIVVCVGLLVLVGLVMTLSASTVFSMAEAGSPYAVFTKQLIVAVAGVGAMALASQIPYGVWRRLGWVVLAAAFALLVAVLAFGVERFGAKRWFEFGFGQVQPAEFAKFGILLVSAAVLERRWRQLDDVRLVMVPLIAPIYVVIAVLLLLQPDLGSALVIGVLVLSLLFLAGTRLRHLAMIAGAAVAGLVVLVLTAGYRLQRLTTFLDPAADREGDGYQIWQSLIAIGSGGVTGRGLGGSRQKWSFLPNAHNDFVFSVVGEELGLVGSVALLLLVLALVVCFARAAARAPDLFGRLVAAGAAVVIALPTILNVAGVTSVLPLDGVPLPFMSAGGSNMLVLLALTGIVLSIARAGDRARSQPAPTTSRTTSRTASPTTTRRRREQV